MVWNVSSLTGRFEDFDFGLVEGFLIIFFEFKIEKWELREGERERERERERETDYYHGFGQKSLIVYLRSDFSNIIGIC